MGQPLHGLRLLVVEDEALVAMLVEDLLVDLGCVVVDVAGTLEAGLKTAALLAPSIDGAILDVNLGEADAFPIADVLMAHGVKFIFATGYGPDRVKGRYAHHVVLSKPFRRDALEHALEGVLASES